MQPGLKNKIRRYNMKIFKSGQKGFTLIELLVVIAILGTLAGVVVLNVIQFVGKGKCEAAKTEYHNIMTAESAAAYSNATKAADADDVTWEAFIQAPTKFVWVVTPANGSTGASATCAGCPTVAADGCVAPLPWTAAD
jgi:prepilin-type N-terminal cleavage/methylation domain-containing protein